MSLNRAQLEQRYKELAGQFVQLGATIREAAEAMENSGRPLPLLLFDEAQNIRRTFDAFCAQIIKDASTYELDALPRAGEIPDLLALEPLLEQLCQSLDEAEERAAIEARRKAEETRLAEEKLQHANQVRQQMQTLLQRAMRLAHKTRSDFAPLLNCQEQAQRLHQTVAALAGPLTGGEEQMLNQAQVPFKALLRLSTDWNNLDGEDWDNLREEVAGYFGRELATQSARGQLMIKESSNGANASAQELRPFELQPVVAGQQAAARLNTGQPVTVITDASFDWAALEQRAYEIVSEQRQQGQVSPLTPNVLTTPSSVNATPLNSAPDTTTAGQTGLNNLLQRLSQIADDEDTSLDQPAIIPLSQPLTVPPAKTSTTTETQPDKTPVVPAVVADQPAQAGPASSELSGEPNRKGHTREKPSSHITPPSDGSTIAQAALSHWSKLIEELAHKESAVGKPAAGQATKNKAIANKHATPALAEPINTSLSENSLAAIVPPAKELPATPAAAFEHIAALAESRQEEQEEEDPGLARLLSALQEDEEEALPAVHAPQHSNSATVAARQHVRPEFPAAVRQSQEVASGMVPLALNGHAEARAHLSTEEIVPIPASATPSSAINDEGEAQADALAAETEALLAALRQRPLTELTELPDATPAIQLSKPIGKRVAKQKPPRKLRPLMQENDYVMARLSQEDDEEDGLTEDTTEAVSAFPVAAPPPPPPAPPPLRGNSSPLRVSTASLKQETVAAARSTREAEAIAAPALSKVPDNPPMAQQQQGQEDTLTLTAPSITSAGFDDYETVPQGFEEGDEKEQSFYYVALEEKKAPFYFAGAPQQALYNFQSDLNAAQIALAIEKGAAPERLNALRDLQWRLMFEEQFGLAFFLARALEAQSPAQRICLPSWLVRSVVIGQSIRYDEGELAQLMRTDFRYCTNNWLKTPSEEWNRLIVLFVAAAALRPVLLAPSTRAARILRQLPAVRGLEHLHQFCQQLAQTSTSAAPFDANLLKVNQGKSAWHLELVGLRREVETWWKQAPFREMEFSPATYVWRNWVEPEGALRSLLPVHLPENCDLAAVKRQIKLWSDERQIRREINHTDRELIGRSLGQKDIDGDAFKQILDATREAVDLARRWIGLIENNPMRGNQNKPLQSDVLHTLMTQMYANVTQELDALSKPSALSSVALLGALHCCRKALNSLHDLVANNSLLHDGEPKIRHLLYAPLLATNLPISWRWKPEITDSNFMLTALVQMIAKGLPLDWKRAFAERGEARDHETTGYIIQYLETDPASAPLAEEMRRDRDQMIVNSRAVLRQELEETRKQIITALDLGYVSEKDYLKIAAQIDGLETAKFLRFGPAHIQLQNIRETLTHKREAAIAAVREKMELSNIGAEHYYYQQINRVLEQGDIVTAEDYLGMVLDHQELPESEETRDSLANFYPEKARELSEHLKQLPLYAIIQRARAGADLCGLRLKDYDLEMVAGAISAWFNSRRMQTISEEEAAQILPFLGFVKKELSVATEGENTWIHLTIDPLAGRERSPVPIYGSEAKGRYRILCVWDRPTEEELLQQIGDTSLNAPVIIFYFGQMNDDMRPSLARLCRERRQTVIVIDDVLILYLYGQRAPRLRTMFECTLPFTWTEPYTATSVPPEMFYGRVQERRSIMSPTGSGFVYGGRRLGKTALLRDVERSFHDPEKGRLALFFDLEGENIGTQRQLDDLWLLIGEELKRLKVISGTFNDPAALLDQITLWLEGDHQRRILLLLDQADRFLEADEKEQFVRASRLRGVMEKTNRRFKVIFAGVHNIPRMTRIPDHPLAQFGTPISIGPLLGHEAHEARKLIEEPLAALGYLFESPDFVRRILWRTNYYPSLIQHYCYHLLKYLTNPARQQSYSGPPYYITSEDVDEAYRSQDMRAAIRAGLLLTLQVDERYSVIAYALADALLHNGEECLTEGHSVAWISQQANYWWPDGFQSVLADNSLPVLLDEMVGLGILRPTDRGYSLRSKGVAVLLGSEDQISAELARTRKTPPKYNPSTFRAARTGSPRRSPLTAQEMMELRLRQNGVSIIFGNEAASLPDLRQFVEVASPRGSFVALDNDKYSTFSKQLKELPNRTQDGTLLILVCPTCDWDDRWIEEALQATQTLSSQRTFARVAFIADPGKTWRLVNRQAAPFELLPGRGITTYSLKPWHDDVLRQWLDDRSFNIDEQGRERVTAVTGNWPMLLEYFYQRSQIDSFHWMEHLRATSRDLKDKPVARDLARALGLDQSSLQEATIAAKRILLALETGGEQSVDLLLQRLGTVSNDISEDTVKRVLWWAELLSLVSRVGPRWRIDHLAGRLLKTVGG